jgi:hypothetical protein
VLFAAWLGWGFDVFDGLLFNYVAPNCVPTLLGLPIGSPEAKQATLWWTGLLTSVLLLGWAAGGVLFACRDRIGRRMLLTMLLYALGTAACAARYMELILFRLVASLGIGGNGRRASWLPGHARRRVEAGALLCTAGPVGLFSPPGSTSGSRAWFWTRRKPPGGSCSCSDCSRPAPFLVIVPQEPERWARCVRRNRGRDCEVVQSRDPRHHAARDAAGIDRIDRLVECNAFIPTVAAGLAQSHAQSWAGSRRDARAGRAWKTRRRSDSASAGSPAR